MQLRGSQTFEAFPENQLLQQGIVYAKTVDMAWFWFMLGLVYASNYFQNIHCILYCVGALFLGKAAFIKRARRTKKKPYAYSSLGLFALQRTSQLLKYIELTQWLRSKNCLGMEFHVQYVLKSCSKRLFFLAQSKKWG